jgi:NitT/TauT family transport system substrate-binding protein
MRRVLHQPPGRALIRYVRTASVAGIGAGIVVVSACGAQTATESSGGGTVTVNIGYQSKTINTVTAGTLLREHGIFEDKLGQLGEETGVDYAVEWLEANR